MPDDSRLKAKSTQPGAIAAIASALLWVVGFILAFLIPPSSPLIFIPDFLLLLGFLPLLYVWKPSWPWILFGALNIAIGVILQVSRFLPDAELPVAMRSVRQHLADYHQPLVWVAVGFASMVYGLVRGVKNIFVWWRSRNTRV